MLIPNTLIQAASGGQAILYDSTLGGAGTFSVSGISQSYKQLSMYLIGRSDEAANGFGDLMITVNGIASAYYDELLYASTTNVTAVGRSNQADGRIGLVTKASAAQPIVCTIQIPFYSNTVWRKSVMSQYGSHGGAAFDALTGTGCVITAATAGITEFTLYPAGFNFGADSRLIVYGV